MTTKIQARIDEQLKAEVEQILAGIGVTTSELMRMTFQQVAMRKGVPFELKIPNDETLKAFEEAKDPQNFTVYSSTEEAFDDILGKKQS
jgi:DNA-damage-inducible protein J